MMGMGEILILMGKLLLGVVCCYGVGRGVKRTGGRQQLGNYGVT